MFYEWVSAGAIFGIEAFFAVFMFAACLFVLVAFAALIGSVIKAGSGDDDIRRD